MFNIGNLGIKAKLIILFVVVKLIPLFLIAFIAIKGIDELNCLLKVSNQETLDNSHMAIKKTADIAIADSIDALDKKSQVALEIKTNDIAKDVADFLYERDDDLIFLANLKQLNRRTLLDFYDAKTRTVIIPQKFEYDDEKKTWKPIGKTYSQKSDVAAKVADNKKYFNHNINRDFANRKIRLYKEISVIDLNGHELFKVSSIDTKLKDVSKKENTYCKAENYFSQLSSLKKGEIYVSNVIGEYVPTKLIGVFTKERAEAMGIDFEPEKHGYAGFENPLGKKFEGIVRFATPIYENGKKVGYITFALDHAHIMEFTDYIIPTEEAYSNYSDASRGNYAFMWDNLGRNISHPRDYFIVGYDSKTGEKVKPWLSNEIAEKVDASGLNWEAFLKDYPTFDDQSLKKKPNIKQLKSEGSVALDCRYLNFAPQCTGWMTITEDGGYGSFVIFWSKVWKLTTVAAIPYHTGQYANSKRGFGFVTLGANLDEFHEATIKTKNNIDNILVTLEDEMNQKYKKNHTKIESQISTLVNELSVSTLLMTVIVVFIALWIAKYITSSIKKLVEGTVKFKQKKFDYRIKVTSNDEIGILGNAFNEMAQKVEENITFLDKKVADKTREIERSKNKMQKYINIIDEYIIVSSTDMDGNITNASAAFCKICGYTKDELIGKNHNIIRHPDMPDEQFASLWSTIKSGKEWSGEIKNLKKDGTHYWVDATVFPLLDDEGKRIGYTSIRQDITNKKIVEEISITDGLTNIYNRRHFNNLFPRIVNSAKRADEFVAFLIMDIDFFKQYNDSKGHHNGDIVLTKVASAMKNTVKRADDYCFRLGGEEFGVIFKVESKEKAYQFADIIRKNIEELHIEHPKSSVSKYITVSGGVVCRDAKDVSDVQNLYKIADKYLYDAKELGRNRISHEDDQDMPE